MSSIGPFVKDTVIPAGMSVSEAARKLGIGRPALSNLLNGNATLSRDLALKLERVFGADADMLIRRQAEAVHNKREQLEEARAARQRAAGYLKITSTDIANWAGTIAARTQLPVFLRRLVHADTDAGTAVDFPGNDAGERKGWDGLTDAASSGHWVPEGRTGWELSTASDLQSKANSDIREREKLPKAERARTTFTFVTARSWPGKKDWAAAQRQRGQWRDVRAYDAADLEQWLERSAVTQLWFARELGRATEGVVPVGECWRRWAESTKPTMSPTLFDETIQEYRQSLVNWIEGENELPFVVVADSADEALAFLALALLEPDGLPGALHSRTALATNAEAMLRLSAAAPEAVLISADRETEIAASSLTRRNRIIVVRPRTSVTNDADLAVATPSSECFGHALGEMGFDESQIEQLKEESGLSQTILRRRLALTPALKLPPWASEKGLLRKLMPMLLAGAWNRNVEADRFLIEELAGKGFEEVEADIGELLALPDSPVWAIGSYRGLVSRKDALFIAGADLTAGDLDRFFEVAHFILSEDDPALDLVPEDRWAANIRGKKRDISGAMRMAVGELLVLLTLHSAQVLGPQIEQVPARIDALVYRLLNSVETRKWLSQQADLPLLAEASPRAFLDAVELDLRNEEPQLLAMLRPVEAGGFDSPDRTGLLWALEVIAWNDACLYRVARVLARLSVVPINDNWVNKPENSLLSLVRSWFPQTRADIEVRLNLLDMLVREFPSVGWRLCKAQIDSHGGMATPNSKPRWRTDAAFVGYPDDDEIIRMNRHALDLMLAWPVLELDQLCDLISQSVDLPEEDQNAIWSRGEQWLEAGPDDEARSKLREHMRRSVLSRRNRKKPRLTKIDKRRRSLFEALAPADPVERHRWLFAEHWVSESGDDLWNDDFDHKKHEAHIDALRRTAMGEIIACANIVGVGRLLSSSNAWGTVGHYLWQITAPVERAALVQDVLGQLRTSNDRHWFGYLEGVMRSFEDSDRMALLAELLPKLDDVTAIHLLRAAPFDGLTWQSLEQFKAHLQVQYWREVTAFGWRLSETDINRCIERLLDVDRPISAFNAMVHEFEHVAGPILARLMKALAQPTKEAESDVRLNAAALPEALEALNESGSASQADLAQYEYLFVGALSHTKYGIPNLEKQIADSPSDFVQLVSLLYNRDDGSHHPDDPKLPEGERKQAVGENVFRALSEIKRTPGTQPDGRLDKDALLAWMVDARERFRLAGRADIGDSQIGQLLGRSLQEADGIWPGEAVRDVLEACNSDRMMRGMEIGLFNNRKTMWRSAGGGLERGLAERYRAFARQMASEYPTSMRLLEQIAESYDSRAEWHETDEAVRSRLRRR